MAKASIKTLNGTKITIDGNQEEISKIINAISRPESHKTEQPNENIRKSKMKSKFGLTDYLRELKEEGFFDAPKNLLQIRDELATKAYIYPITSIQPVLIRLVKTRELGRLKQDSKWVYVKR